MAALTFPEVRRALQALSMLYVHRREKLPDGHGLDSAGKRAAYALFFGPLHYLAVEEVVRGMELTPPGLAEIVDLGCGTGAASAAWAAQFEKPPQITACDRNNWAVEEARRTCDFFGFRATVRRADLGEFRTRGRHSAVLAAWAANEQEESRREALLRRLLSAAERGSTILVVEPIAKRLNPWIDKWIQAFEAAGGSSREWRLKLDLPPLLAELDRAAGLNHRTEVTCRTLVLNRKP